MRRRRAGSGRDGTRCLRRGRTQRRGRPWRCGRRRSARRRTRRKRLTRAAQDLSGARRGGQRPCGGSDGPSGCEHGGRRSVSGRWRVRRRGLRRRCVLLGRRGRTGSLRRLRRRRCGARAFRPGGSDRRMNRPARRDGRPDRSGRSGRFFGGLLRFRGRGGLGGLGCRCRRSCHRGRGRVRFHLARFFVVIRGLG